MEPQQNNNPKPPVAPLQMPSFDQPSISSHEALTKPAVPTAPIPTAQPLPTASPTQGVSLYNDHKPGKSKKGLLLGLAVVLLLLLLAGVGYWLWSSGKIVTTSQTPEQATVPQAVAMGRIEGADFTGSLAVEVAGSPTTTGILSGSFDLSNIQNLVYDVKLAPTDNAQSQTYNLRRLGQKLYINLSLPPIALILPSGLTQQWLDLSTVRAGKTVNAQLTQILEAVYTTPVFQVTSVAGEEAVQGVATTKYGFTVKTDDIVKAINAYLSVYEDRTLTAGEEKSIRDMNPTFNDAYIWVGKDDQLLHRISFVVKLSPTSGPMTITGDITLTNLNQPSEVAAPADAKSIETVLGAKAAGFAVGLFNSSISDIVMKGFALAPEINNTQEFTTDTDADGLNDLLEQAYGTDPKKPDTDSDGYNDGAEVKAGYNPAGPGYLYANPTGQNGSAQ